MFTRTISPLTLCITGLGWLMLASILGMAPLVGLIHSSPLPPWVGALHVHAVLVGGVTQIILGGLFLLIPPAISADRKEPGCTLFTFWTMNGGVIGMLVGFTLHRYAVVGMAGLVVMAAWLSVIQMLWHRVRRSWNLSSMESWYYALPLLCLLGGAVCGELMALGFVPESYGYLRLAHIHLGVLGFVVLAIIGIVHNLLPTIWNRPRVNPKLAQTGIILILLGLAVLIGGFLNSSVSTELVAGAILGIGGMLWAGSLLRTWLSSTSIGNAAADHLFVSVFFLLVTIVLGGLVGANRLSDPPTLPYGKLHLVAYTHMTFIGFIVNAVVGIGSYIIPLAVAADRVPNTKKRGPYQDQLIAVMNRWSLIQVAALSLGTMGLGLLAALTWTVPLTSLSIGVAAWTSLGLLMTGLVLFAVKLTSIITKKPETLRAAQTSADELKLTA